VVYVKEKETALIKREIRLLANRRMRRPFIGVLR
jgi:hypothetical protein